MGTESGTTLSEIYEIFIRNKNIELLEKEIENLQGKMNDIRTLIDKYSDSVFEESTIKEAFEICQKRGVFLDLEATAYVHHILSEFKKIIDAD